MMNKISDGQRNKGENNICQWSSNSGFPHNLLIRRTRYHDCARRNYLEGAERNNRKQSQESTDPNQAKLRPQSVPLSNQFMSNLMKKEQPNKHDRSSRQNNRRKC